MANLAHNKGPGWGERGFTLIELLVVVSTISMLASIVLSATSSSRNKAYDSIILQDSTQFFQVAAGFTGSFSDYPSPTSIGAGTCLQLQNEPLFASADFRSALTQAVKSAGYPTGDLSQAGCLVSSTYWLVALPMRSKPGSSYCVNSLPESKTEPATPAVLISHFGSFQFSGSGPNCDALAQGGSFPGP